MKKNKNPFICYACKKEIALNNQKEILFLDLISNESEIGQREELIQKYVCSICYETQVCPVCNRIESDGCHPSCKF